MLSGIAVLMVAVPHVEILAVRLFTVGLCFNVFIRWHQAVVQEVGVRCDRVSLGVESCKIVFLGSISYSLVHFCCSIVLFSQSTLRHRQTDGQTDIQTGRRQYHAKGRSYCVQQYDRLKMLGQHAMMLVRCREEIFMRRTTWYNSHRGNATLHTILRDN